MKSDLCESSDGKQLLECLRPTLKLAIAGPHEVAPALEVVEFLYTGRVKSTTVVDLLRVRRQAAYIGSRRCEAACDTALASVNIDFEDACGVFDFIEAGLLGTPVAQSLRERCVGLLVSHLGSAHECMQDEVRRALLLQLPAAALEAVLASEQLEADSENSVLAMVISWQAEHQPDDATLRRLLHNVRLGCLSNSYMDSVLPDVAGPRVLRPLLCAELRMYAHARSNRSAQDYYRSLLYSGKTRTWYLPPRKCLPTSVLKPWPNGDGLARHLVWRLPIGEVEQLLRKRPGRVGAVSSVTSPVLGFFCGYGFRMVLRYSWASSSVSPRLELRIAALHSVTEGLQEPQHPLVVQCSALLGCTDAALRTRAAEFKRCLLYADLRSSSTSAQLPKPSSDVQADMLKWRTQHCESDGCVVFNVVVAGVE